MTVPAAETDPMGSFRALARELSAAFRAWEARPEPWSGETLDALARRAFAVQHAGNRPYRLYCERIGVSPDDIGGWRDVPPVPTEAFREVALCVGGAEAVAEVYRTSGTTRGGGRRGSHPVVDPGLYRASAEAAFGRHVLGGPDAARGVAAGRDPERGEGPVLVSLVPPFAPRRESSLSWMAEALVDRFGAPGSGFAAGPEGIRWDRAASLLEGACDAGRPVCVLATTLAADEWTRRLRSAGVRYEPPPGSRLMDTGGAKGRPGLERSRVVEAVEERLGIRPSAVVNEFGMTELLSQRYSRPAAAVAPDPVPPDTAPPAAGGPVEAVRLYGPPWLRTRALDPVGLEELPQGEAGLLCHFDLANAGSVCGVLTEDLGRVRGNVVEWIGRTPGATPRGCSLATAELLAAQEDG